MCSSLDAMNSSTYRQRSMDTAYVTTFEATVMVHPDHGPIFLVPPPGSLVDGELQVGPITVRLPFAAPGRTYKRPEG